MMIWPFLIAFGAAMSVFARSWVAVCVTTAWILTQFLPNELLVKFFMWQVVGTFIVVALREQVSGALVIASGLCYPIANFIGVGIAVGSWPFVLSDIAVVSAVVIGSRGGLAGWLGRIRGMGWPDNRRDNCYSYNGSRDEEKGWR